MYVYAIFRGKSESVIRDRGASQKRAFAYRRASFHAGATRDSAEYREYRKGE